METIEINGLIEKSAIKQSGITLVLGFFDGVHLGHQNLLNVARKVSKKDNTKVAVMTFNQHPSVTISGKKQDDFEYLTPMIEKKAIFEELGVNILYVVDFNQNFKNLSPKEFVENYLIRLNAKNIIVGQDYTFGNKSSGNVKILNELSENRYKVYQVDFLTENHQKIGSTQLRKLVDSGNMEDATKMLGRPYSMVGEVVHGFQRGRKLGFPTLNIEPVANKRIPAEGVYAVQVEVQGLIYNGMASIGRNETFGQGLKKTIEINLFDFNRTIYGQTVKVYWFKKIRDMVAFENIDQLINQLQADKSKVKLYFS
ncbi:fad synthetase [Ligilactobacillus hayakitensis DSM 18933 = JCM 14209]|uniref:Riboflavin biosynthesis protein n=1 Tax=Ligilactobacillus hayakitensis DSM 18933 = JCM 14209 TaxID=1423755 RepID=A0A0R1WLW1_9LACO|nr:riboflavin biosynthesis protein RibF [Ligilactobacillus hayakitensis]KRM18818.1 fad synthetase [Ligilactobacillus hayakitensis DSM 18933 = JCM 14209]